MNIEAIAEYRASVDAAEAVTCALGLKEIVDGAHVLGDLSSEGACEAWGYLDEIFALAGKDPKVHERRASRQMNALVRKNEPLVVKVARRTLGARAGVAANLEEAVQEGCIGLVHAIKCFDVSKGKFSTWAAFQIRHHVQTCAHKQVDFAKQRSAMMPPRVAKAMNKFRLLNGREPRSEELVYETADGETRRVSPEEWARWHDVTYTTSIEEFTHPKAGPAGREGDGHIPEIADPRLSPEGQIANMNLQEKLAETMADMSPRNRELTKALFIEGRPFPEVGEAMGLSPQRVHQLKGVLEKRLRKVLAA